MTEDGASVDIEEVERAWNTRARLAVNGLRFRTARREVALVISGGGSQGSFEAGVLRFLYDHVAVRPVAICGNSVGAIIAAKLAEGDDPATGVAPVDDVERIWRSMTSNADMWLAEPWLETLQSSASWATELRDHLTASGSAGTQGRLVFRLLGNVIRNPPETDGTLIALRQALRAASMLSLAPVRDLVERELRPERVAASGIRLRLGTVGLESGELRYVTEEGQLVSRDNKPLDLPPVALADGVLASSSIPMVFPPVRLGDEHYVDGGAREIIPLELAFTHLGADRIFAVSAGALGVRPAPSFENRGMLDIVRRVMTEIAPDETLRKELHPPRGWGRRVSIVSPEFDVHDALTVDPGLIAVSIDYGWMRAADLLLGLGERSAELTEAITRTRIRLRQLDGPIEGFLTPARDTPATLEAAEERGMLRQRLRTLVEQRRTTGIPLPPGTAGWEETGFGTTLG